MSSVQMKSAKKQGGDMVRKERLTDIVNHRQAFKSEFHAMRIWRVFEVRNKVLG